MFCSVRMTDSDDPKLSNAIKRLSFGCNSLRHRNCRHSDFPIRASIFRVSEWAHASSILAHSLAIRFLGQERQWYRAPHIPRPVTKQLPRSNYHHRASRAIPFISIPINQCRRRDAPAKRAVQPVKINHRFTRFATSLIRWFFHSLSFCVSSIVVFCSLLHLLSTVGNVEHRFAARSIGRTESPWMARRQLLIVVRLIGDVAIGVRHGAPWLPWHFSHSSRRSAQKVWNNDDWNGREIPFFLFICSLVSSLFLFTTGNCYCWRSIRPLNVERCAFDSALGTSSMFSVEKRARGAQDT